MFLFLYFEQYNTIQYKERQCDLGMMPSKEVPVIFAWRPEVHIIHEWIPRIRILNSKFYQVPAKTYAIPIPNFLHDTVLENYWRLTIMLEGDEFRYNE